MTKEYKKSLHVIRAAIIIILFIIATYCVYYIVKPMIITYKNDNLNKNISKKYHQSIEKNTNFKDRYSDLEKINPDIVGWLNISGTKVDYPVVRTNDNSFYLIHNFEKQPSNHGSIFMDFRNMGDLKTKNNIIYGHNMKDGSMFQQLMNFKDKSYFESHPIIEFDTLTEPIKWQIFSVYVTSTKFNYIRTEFNNDSDYEDFLKQLKSHSMYDTGVNVSKDDTILTLSTCSYEIEDGRLAIEAKRIK